MYRILFVDEVEDDARRFQRYVHNKDINDEFKVIVKKPIEEIDDLIDEIFSEHIDAIISDYQLAEYMQGITYTGVELINRVLMRKSEFPCFVMTSHDDEAVATSSDVNIVYIKGVLAKEDNVKVTFLERVKRQIDNYKSGLHDAQNEFNEILHKSKDNLLTASDELRLAELDTFLEKSLDQESQIPVQLKNKSTLNDLHKLIENTDVLLKKIEDCSK